MCAVKYGVQRIKPRLDSNHIATIRLPATENFDTFGIFLNGLLLRLELPVIANCRIQH